jgi:hypothetical protein
MKSYLFALATVGMLAGISGQAQATGCSTTMMAGRWVFATGIGHQALLNAPPPADITAIGTMNVDWHGNLDGAFNVTFEGAAFVPGIPYSGTLTVNPDCTGTVTFVTGTGAARTDSIVVLNRYEFWGMSEDPSNLWTYQARRLPGRLH